jgi:heptosyltransferase II
MRLGVFLPNWIGDVVMATPALRALRRKFGPQTEMIGVMRPYVADVLSGTDWFDDVLLYKKGASEPDLSRRMLVKKLRAANLDEILLLTNSIRTAWMAWLSGVRVRTGYVGDLRRWFLTNRLSQPRSAMTGKPLPTLDSYLHLASALGCPPESPTMELATTVVDELAADAAWQKLGLANDERVVVINSGGAFGAAKNWPLEHFAALAKRIVSEWGGYVLVNSGPKERPFASEIVTRAADRRVLTLADIEHLPVGLTKAAIRRARLLITTDSGPRFFGIAFGKSVVTLFGPTDPIATQTHYPHETCLSLSLDCQPCRQRSCPLGHHRCMRDLSVERVYAAVARRLAADEVVPGAA